jgi:hypothetical protein
VKCAFHFPTASSGVALVITLMMMSVLMMMVVGLAGVMRNEQAAARNQTYQVIAEQMADLGARQGMAAVAAAGLTDPARTWASGPGWMISNGTWVPLFSTSTVSGTKNLEEVGTNSLVLSLPDNVRGELRTGWSNLVAPGDNANRPMGRTAYWVDDEGTKVNLDAVGSNNSAGYLPLLTNFPYSADWVFVDPATGQTNAAASARARALAGRSNALATTESLKDTNVIGLTGANQVDATTYRRAKGHITAWSSNMDLTPWGTLKFNLNDLTNTAVYPTPAAAQAALKAVLSTNAWTNFFPADMTLGRKYGGGGTRATNAGNHGDLVLQQIAANMMAAVDRPVINTNFEPVRPDNNLRRHRSNMPQNVASHYVGPFLEQVRVRVDWRITALTNVDGRLLIWVRVVNPTASNAANWSLKVQPRKWKYVVAPASGNFASARASNVVYGAPLSGFPFPPDEGFNIVPGPAWEVPSNIFNKSWPSAQSYTSNSLSFAAGSTNDFFFNNVISFTLANVTTNELPASVTRAYVMLDQVGLYDSASPANANLKDWLTHDDLAQVGNLRNDAYQDYGQFSFHPGLYEGAGGAPVDVGPAFPAPSPGLFGPGNSLGVRKVDPQVRFPICFFVANPTQAGDMGRLRANGWPDSANGARAWTINAAFNCTNTNGSVTGLSYLWPDPAPGVTDVLDHPHFVAGYRPTNGFRSVAQLGAIHTGIPWRTLRLQPTPAVERTGGGANNFPPDWILLDAFTAATNPAAPPPMVNLNGVPRALVNGNPGVAENSNGTVPTRGWALACAMGAAGTNLSGPTNVAASNGVPISLKTNSFTNLAGIVTNLTAVLSNPLAAGGWSASSGWRTFRSANPNIFTTNGLVLKGELLEVLGVADDSAAGEDVVEGRLRAFLDLVTTRSDTFCVWSAGQGLAVVTNAGGNPIRTNVMGEVRKQTVFQRVPQTNASGQVTGYRYRVLYSRNHVVE